MQEQDLDQETEADLGHRVGGGRGQAEAAGGEAHQGQGPPDPLQAGEHLNTLIIISQKNLTLLQNNLEVRNFVNILGCFERNIASKK